MKTVHTSILKMVIMLGLCLLFFSCGGGGGDDDDGCDCDYDPISESSGLVLIFEDQNEETPANVSVLFKAETEDGEPLTRLRSGYFQIYEDDDLISEYESQQTIVPKPEKFISHTLLLLDLSGSVVGSENLATLREAAESFVTSMMPESDDDDYGELDMGIWWFDGAEDIHQLVSFTTEADTLISGIDDIYENISDDNSTNLYGATIKGIEKMEDMVGNKDHTVSVGSVVIFTDGKDQASRKTRDEALTAVDDVDTDISIYTIGLSGETDDATLDAIGRDGYVSASDIDELIPKFEEIATAIRDDVNSHYMLEYCSPKRSGSHDLKIVLNYQNMSGALITCFCASGFEGGCAMDDF